MKLQHYFMAKEEAKKFEKTAEEAFLRILRVNLLQSK